MKTLKLSYEDLLDGIKALGLHTTVFFLYRIIGGYVSSPNVLMVIAMCSVLRLRLDEVIVPVTS